MRKNRKNLDVPAQGKQLPGLKETAGMLLTFILVCFAWIFFRASDMEHALNYIGNMFIKPWGSIEVERRMGVFILFMLMVEWINRTREHGLELDKIHSRIIRWTIYLVVALLTFYFGTPGQTFIYFQF